MIIFGDFMDVSSVENELDMFIEIAIMMAWLGVFAFVGGWVGNMCFEAAGMNIAARWRKEYLKGILRQDVAWFDTNNPNELSGKIASITQDLEQGINGKITEIPRFLIGQGLLGLGIAFYYSWDMALVMIAASPLVMIGAMFLTQTTAWATKEMNEAYSKA